MDIQSATYTDSNETAIRVVTTDTNEEDYFVPVEPKNRHYEMVQQWVDAHEDNIIQAAP